MAGVTGGPVDSIGSCSVPACCRTEHAGRGPHLLPSSIFAIGAPASFSISVPAQRVSSLRPVTAEQEPARPATAGRFEHCARTRCLSDQCPVLHCCPAPSGPTAASGLTAKNSVGPAGPTVFVDHRDLERG